jgi:hypothetical protein
VVLDTQSVRAANHVPAATTGKDAAKRVPGRKRGLAVDAAGGIVVAPGVFTRPDDRETDEKITHEQKTALSALHLRKIDLMWNGIVN